MEFKIKNITFIIDADEISIHNKVSRIKLTTKGLVSTNKVFAEITGIRQKVAGDQICLPLSEQEIGEIRLIQSNLLKILENQENMEETTKKRFLESAKVVNLAGTFYRQGNHTILKSCEGIDFQILRNAENLWYCANEAFSKGIFPFENPIKLVITGMETEDYNGFHTEKGITTQEFWYY